MYFHSYLYWTVICDSDGDFADMLSILHIWPLVRVLKSYFPVVMDWLDHDIVCGTLYTCILINIHRYV